MLSHLILVVVSLSARSLGLFFFRCLRFSISPCLVLFLLGDGSEGSFLNIRGSRAEKTQDQGISAPLILLTGQQRRVRPGANQKLVPSAKEQGMRRGQRASLHCCQAPALDFEARLEALQLWWVPDGIPAARLQGA